MVDTVLYTSLGGVDLQLSGWQEMCSMSSSQNTTADRGILQRDDRNQSNVALKIAKVQAESHELRILRHLRDSSVAHDYTSHPGRQAVVRLLDDFTLGRSHRALVLDVMGMDVQSKTESMLGNRLPKKTLTSVARQLALGLDYLWKCGVAHGGKSLSLAIRMLLTPCVSIKTFMQGTCSSLLRMWLQCLRNW